MFREMRRKKQQMTEDEVKAVLERATSGVLALSGDDGYPYAVPLSFLYDGDCLYFHGTKVGHKMDAVRRNPKASFCVIDQDEVVPEKYTTCYRSVIVFGEIREVEEEEEKRASIEKLALKYAPEDSEANRQRAIASEWEPLCMLRMQIAHMTGKEGRELLQRRGEKGNTLLSGQ